MHSVRGYFPIVDLPRKFFLPSSVLTHECKRNRSAFWICHFRPCMSSKVLKGTVELPMYCLTQKSTFIVVFSRQPFSVFIFLWLKFIKSLNFRALCNLKENLVWFIHLMKSEKFFWVKQIWVKTTAPLLRNLRQFT